MGTLLTGLAALSTCHPEQNPALAGQHVYKSREVQDKQIVRLIGKVPTLAAAAYHRLSGRKPTPPNQRLGYAEVRWVGGWWGFRVLNSGRNSSAILPFSSINLVLLPNTKTHPTHHPTHQPTTTTTHPLHQNFLFMLDAAGRADYRPNPRLARALDVLFLLHAEHELNCSTSAARHLASSGVDVYTAVMVRGAVGDALLLFHFIE